MRIPIVAGNWKMNTTVTEAAELTRAMKGKLDGAKGVETLLCPPFISLVVVRDLIKGSSIKLGAQNMHFEEGGAYTGEISAAMLSGLCEFVILGHSERRAYFGESDEIINKKVRAALAAGLKPILCVGERLEENEAGRAIEVVTRQLRVALAGISLPRGLVIAYEPVWAIGSGRAASGDQANIIIGVIRSIIAELYGGQVAEGMRLQYGGSVSSANIAEFVGQPEIDGALVGGASLKAAEFLSIVEQSARIKKQA